MRFSSRLPTPPHFDIEVVEEHRSSPDGFLRSVRRLCRTRDTQGRMSPEFHYDEVDRRALDAVVIVPHFLRRTETGALERTVVLRSAIRPPVILRRIVGAADIGMKSRALWEVPAGLVEEHEGEQEELAHAAARELLEEAGFDVSVEQLHPLGPSSFPAPGIIAERHYYFHVEVDPETQVEPPLDGSPLEKAGELVAVPLHAALRAAKRGELADAKTELALRRFSEWLEGEIS